MHRFRQQSGKMTVFCSDYPIAAGGNKSDLRCKPKRFRKYSGKKPEKHVHIRQKNAKSRLSPLYRLLDLFLPGILQADGTVKNGALGSAVRINTKVSQACKLKFFACLNPG